MVLSRRQKLWLMGLATPVLAYAFFSVVTGAGYVLAVMTSSYMADQPVYPATAAEARARGVWLDTIKVWPRQVRYADYELTFRQAWFYQAQLAHRPAWYASRVLQKESRALFHLGYTVRYVGAAPPSELAAPWVAGPYTGGHPLYQAIGHEQTLTVVADLPRDSTLDVPLPLPLLLTGGRAESTRRLLVVPRSRWYGRPEPTANSR